MAAWPSAPTSTPQYEGPTNCYFVPRGPTIMPSAPVAKLLPEGTKQTPLTIIKNLGLPNYPEAFAPSSVIVCPVQNKYTALVEYTTEDMAQIRKCEDVLKKPSATARTDEEKRTLQRQKNEATKQIHDLKRQHDELKQQVEQHKVCTRWMSLIN